MRHFLPSYPKHRPSKRQGLNLTTSQHYGLTNDLREILISPLTLIPFITFAIFLVSMCVRGFMVLIIATVLCARSQDSVLPVSVRRVDEFFTAGFKGG